MNISENKSDKKRIIKTSPYLFSITLICGILGILSMLIVILEPEFENRTTESVVSIFSAIGLLCLFFVLPTIIIYIIAVNTIRQTAKEKSFRRK